MIKKIIRTSGNRFFPVQLVQTGDAFFIEKKASRKFNGESYPVSEDEIKPIMRTNRRSAEELQALMELLENARNRSTLCICAA